MVLHRRSVQGGLLHLFGKTVQGTIITLEADGLNRDWQLRRLLLGSLLLLRNGSGDDGGPLLLWWLLDNRGLLLLNDRCPLGGIVVTEDMLLQCREESALALLWWLLGDLNRLRTGLLLRLTRLDWLAVVTSRLHHRLGSSSGGGDPGGLARGGDGRDDGGDSVDGRRLGGGLCSGDWVHGRCIGICNGSSGTRWNVGRT